MRDTEDGRKNKEVKEQREKDMSTKKKRFRMESEIRRQSRNPSQKEVIS